MPIQIEKMFPRKNLAQEKGYCAYFNYEKCICHGGDPSQALVTQDQPLVQHHDPSQPIYEFQP